MSRILFWFRNILPTARSYGLMRSLAFLAYLPWLAQATHAVSFIYDHRRVGCFLGTSPTATLAARKHQSSPPSPARTHLNAAKHNTSQVGPHQDIRHAHVHVNAINQGAPSLSTLSLAPARQPLSHRRLEAVLDKLARVARLHPHALRHRRPLRRVHLEQVAEVVEPASRGDLGVISGDLWRSRVISGKSSAANCTPARRTPPRSAPARRPRAPARRPACRGAGAPLVVEQPGSGTRQAVVPPRGRAPRSGRGRGAREARCAAPPFQARPAAGGSCEGKRISAPNLGESRLILANLD